MNGVTAAYLGQCRRNHALREAVRAAAYPPVYTECYDRLLPRPMFIEGAVVRQFADDLASIFRMLVSLPARLFGGGIDRYCAAVGITGPLKDLMTRGDDYASPLFGRSDAHFDGTGFRPLEFNIGTELGEWTSRR